MLEGKGLCEERRYAREDMYVGGREAFAAADALISALHRYFRGFTPFSHCGMGWWWYLDT